MIPFLRFSRTYLLPYWHWYLGGTVALFLTNWLSVEIPMYLAQGIDALSLGEDGRPIILRSAGIVAAMGVAVFLIRSTSRLLFFTPGRLVEAQVKYDLFAKMLRHQPVFLDQWPTGDLVSRVASDVNMIRLLAGFTALGAVNTVVAFGMTGTQMARISPVLAGWVILPLIGGFLVTVAFMGRLRTIMKQMQEQTAVISDHVLSSYQGIPTIHAFQAAPAFQARFHEKNKALLNSMLQRANLWVIIGPTLQLTASVNVFLLLFIGGPMAIRGEISIGELIAFTTLVAYLTGPLRGLSFILGLIKQAQASLERIDAILLPDFDRPELPDPAPMPEGPPSIRVQDLSFAYPTDPDRPVLHDISFQLRAGQTLGILGATGSGKSTLLQCLARLYNPPRGTVFINDTDLLDLDLDAWRQKMAFVPQRALLFSEKVRDNIELGDPDDARLAEVLRRAQLDIDIEALPHGVATVVGESGLTLSGGQRQRVALARGLIRPHDLLILDDVLSAVDHTTEQALLQELRSGPHRPTTLIVAHRVSALQRADLILVLDEGRVADQGTHAELIARPGLYQETWLRQSEQGAPAEASE